MVEIVEELLLSSSFVSRPEAGEGAGGDQKEAGGKDTDAFISLPSFLEVFNAEQKYSFTT